MPRTVVYLRFDRPRNGFVDPKPVDWSNRKENELRAILRDTSGNLDWEKIAQHFNVPTSYVLQQAAWLYEKELHLVKRRMSQFAQGSHLEPRGPRGSGDEHLFMSHLHAPHMHASQMQVPQMQVPQMQIPPASQAPQLHTQGVLQNKLSQANLQRNTPPRNLNSLNPNLSSSGEDSKSPSLQNAIQRSQLTPEDDEDETYSDSEDLGFTSRRLLTTSRIDTLDTDSSEFSDSSLDGLLPPPGTASSPHGTPNPHGTSSTHDTTSAHGTGTPSTHGISDTPATPVTTNTPPTPGTPGTPSGAPSNTASNGAPVEEMSNSLHNTDASFSDDDQVSRSALEAELLEQLNDSSET